MARSEAQKRADKAYRPNAKTQKFQISLKKEEISAINDFVDNVCKPEGISKARFVFWACNDFIQRNEIPPESFIADIDDLDDAAENPSQE